MSCRPFYDFSVLMTLVEGAYGRNGYTADANWAEGGEKTRDTDYVTERSQARESKKGCNRMLVQPHKSSSI